MDGWDEGRDVPRDERCLAELAAHWRGSVDAFLAAADEHGVKTAIEPDQVRELLELLAAALEMPPGRGDRSVSVAEQLGVAVARRGRPLIVSALVLMYAVKTARAWLKAAGPSTLELTAVIWAEALLNIALGASQVLMGLNQSVVEEMARRN